MILVYTICSDNMKKNGFTLLELLVTIALLSAMGLVMVIGLNKVQTNNNKKECKRIISTFETAAEVYVESGNSISSDGVTLTALKELGLIEPNIINPITKEVFDYSNKVNSNYVFGGNICG